jgi:hypothetical protein
LEEYSLHEYQKSLIKRYEDERYVLLRKYRSGCFVTTTMAWILWKFLFEFDQSIIWFGPREIDAKYTAKRFKLMTAMLPEWLHPNLRNKKSIYSLNCDSTDNHLVFCGPTATRGRRASLVVIDDAAFIKDMDDHWKAICRENAFGWFEECWRGSLNGENYFHIHPTHYKDCPYWQDENFCQEVRELLGERGWQQEILGNICPDSGDPTGCWIK